MAEFKILHENCREGQFDNWNYRFEDSEGNVYYCGFTTNPLRRMWDHDRNARKLLTGVADKKIARPLYRKMADRGIADFAMIFHDGDSSRSTRPARLREIEYIEHYRTLIADNPDNPFACNTSGDLAPPVYAERSKESQERTSRLMSENAGRPGIPCKVGDQEFSSYTEAAQEFGCTPTAIRQWIKAGWSGPTGRYVTTPDKEETMIIMFEAGCSTRNISARLGMAVSSVRRRRRAWAGKN